MSRGRQKVPVAVIGAGNMGKNHVRNYFLMPEAELVGLSDVNPDARKIADEYRATFFTDYKKMLDELKPRAVSIVVPTPLHKEVASEVIKRGIHCLLEKPIASTTEEAEELIQLAKKHKVIFTVGHIEHYNPLVTTLKRLLDRNAIGEISSVVCKRVGGFPTIEPKTDVIIDLAVHDIGIIGFLLGKHPQKIYSHGSQTFHSKKVDSAEILIDYGFASGFIQANWLTPVKIRTIAVTGSKGYIEGNYITQELEHYKHTPQVNSDGFSDFVRSMGEPEKNVIKVDFEEPLLVEIKAFLSRIQHDPNVYLVAPELAKEALGVAIQAVSPYEEKRSK